MDQPAQEGPRGDDHGAARVAYAHRVEHGDDAPALHEQSHRLGLAHVEIGRVLDGALHRRAVARAVALGAGGAHGGAARGVEARETGSSRDR